MPLSSDNQLGSSKALETEAEGTQSATQPDSQPKSATSTSAAGEDPQSGMAPETPAQSHHINTATEDTSFTVGETVSSSEGEKQGRTGGEGAEEDEKKKGQLETAGENSLR